MAAYSKKSKREIDLEIEVKVLQRVVANCERRCDEALIAAKNAEENTKQILEAVAKIKIESDKDPWEPPTTTGETNPTDTDEFTSMTQAL